MGHVLLCAVKQVPSTPPFHIDIQYKIIYSSPYFPTNLQSILQMPSSFLRKKLRQTSSAQQQPPIRNPHNTTVRHSLSLPDLTTPLLDPSSWEEVPPFTFTFPAVHTPDSKSDPSSIKRASKGGGGVGMVFCRSPKEQRQQDQQGLDTTRPSARAIGVGIGNTTQTRNRTPSLIENEVQFHRPFKPKMVVNPFPGGWNVGDFRESDAVWDRRGVSAGVGMETRGGVRESMLNVISRRKTRKKGAAEKMNIVVAGGKGVGKTRQVDY